MKKNNSFVLLVLLFLVAGCASVEKSQAEAIAVDFIQKNVKFYTKEENATEDVLQYQVKSVSSYVENKNWNVAVHIETTEGDEVKDNDLLVTVDRKGNVVAFNGKNIRQVGK